MLKELSKMWWIFLLRGIISVIFGLITLSWPGLTLATLVIFYGVFAIVGGIFSIIMGLVNIGRERNWWLMALEGFLGLIVGSLVLEWPGLSLIIFVTVMSIWAIITGIMQIIMAIALQKEMENEWLLALSGVISLIFGLMLYGRPIAGIAVLTWFIAFFALFSGIFFIALSIKFKGLAKK